MFFGRKRRREIGSWVSILPDMNKPSVLVRNIYHIQQNSSAFIHHASSFLSPEGHSEEDFQSVFKQEEKWYNINPQNIQNIICIHVKPMS